MYIQPLKADYETYEAIAKRYGAGFELLELSAPPCMWNEMAAEEFVSFYSNNPLMQSLHGVFIDINPASGDLDFRSLSRKRSHQSCRLAQRLGVKSVVFHSSCFPNIRGAYMQNWASVCADFYLELAETYGLKIYLENSADFDPTPLCTLMQMVNSEDVKVCLDYGHAFVSRVPIATWFSELGDNIAYLHLSDNNGSFDDHLPLGQGKIDWFEADALYRSLERNVPMTLEVGGPKDIEASFAYLKQNKLFEEVDRL